MLYLILNEARGICKIGYSTKPKSRLATLQTATVDQLAIIGLADGERAAEQRLHQAFSQYRVSGEWFEMNDMIMAEFTPLERLEDVTSTQPIQLSINTASTLLHHLTSMKDMRVLLALADLSEFNTNAVFLIAHRRQEVMQQAGVTSAQLSTSLKRLRALNLITGRKGEAIINPSAMWKGNSATRREVIAAAANATL